MKDSHETMHGIKFFGVRWVSAEYYRKRGLGKSFVYTENSWLFRFQYDLICELLDWSDKVDRYASFHVLFGNIQTEGKYTNETIEVKSFVALDFSIHHRLMNLHVVQPSNELQPVLLHCCHLDTNAHSVCHH